MGRTKCAGNCASVLVAYVIVSAVLTCIKGHVLEFVVEPRDTVVVSGSSAVLDCMARSSEYPKSKIMIQWTDQDQQAVTFIDDANRSQLTNGSLYISSVIEDEGVTGTYQCRAALPNIGSIISRAATLKLASLSELTQEPKDLTVFPGQKAYFGCHVHATPPARVRWLKDERPLQLDELRMTILPSGALEIDEVQYADQGAYRCNASGLNQYRLSNKATLMINNDMDMSARIFAPSFVAKPQSQEVIEGDTITLDCAANGNPKPRIIWLKDGVIIDMSHLDSRFRNIGGTNSLQIVNIQESDAGTYQCRAENREDSLDASANVHVQIPPRFLKKPEDKEDYINKDLEFECSIYGKPEPKIQWLKNGEVIKYNEYIHLVNDHNLKILGLMEIDAGLFQCVGSNPAGNVQASARLKIKTTGSKRKKNKNYQKLDNSNPLNDKVRLRTILSSLKHDSSDKTINLGKIDFSHVPSSKEYLLNGRSNHPIDTIQILTSLKSDDHNKYNTNLGITLPAFTEPYPTSTSLGDDLTESGGLQEGLPGHPLDLKAVIIKARFVTLSWKPPEVTNGDVIAYSIYYRQEESLRERVQNTTRSRLEEVIVGSLMPAKTYYFRVVAYNSVGPGPFSEVLKVTTQAEEHVPSSPLHIQAHATGPNSIYVSWKPPDVTNGVIQYYNVYYMESESLIERDMETFETNIELPGLSAFTLYNIWVVAVNSHGTGSSSTEVVVRTFSDFPSEPPYNVTVEPTSSTSITVRWEPPPTEGQNGVITGYKIRFKKQGHKGDTITTPGNIYMHTLNNLDRSSSYQIRLYAINVNGSSPATNWYTVDTFENDLDESTVPEETSVLKARPSTDSIHVMWVPPPNQNIKVRKYILEWGKGIPDGFLEVLDEKQRSYTIKNLEPNSDYVISLRASNNVGPGRARYENVRTRDDIPLDPVVPLIPPVGLKAQVLGASTVVLYWTDTTLSKSQYVTDNRYYVVRYGTVYNPRYRYYNSTDLNCMIADLKANTPYEFTVKVVKGRRESPWSMVVQNTTFVSAPSTAPKDLMVTSGELNPQSVVLSWQPPKQSNGPITGYIIFYTTDNTKRDRDWLVDGVLGDKQTTQIHDLQPMTTYFFKIQARNNKGNGPVSSTVSFRTGQNEKPGPLSGTMVLYLIIGCSIIVVTIIGLVIVIFCCKRTDVNTTPDRSKKGYQKGAVKNQNIKPPDLWIHHDQMELKALEKSHSSNDGASSSGAMTLPRSVGANDYDTHESHPSNSLDKHTYVPSYMGEPSDKNRRVIKAKPISMPMDVKLQREPIASTTPINTASLNQPNTSSDSSVAAGRPQYPRTQYTISRAHVTIDQNALVNAQPPENPYAMQTSYDSTNSPNIYSSQQPAQSHAPSTSSYAPGMNMLPEAQGGKRLQNHPLKSFTVPAPPPTSAPGTPQPKHIVASQVVRPNSSPYKKAVASSGPLGTPVSRISASNPPPHTAEEMQRLAPSYSTEELNQEMANLEGLMKDLNAITASEFEC